MARGQRGTGRATKCNTVAFIKQALEQHQIMNQMNNEKEKKGGKCINKYR